jgi:hypothetical protein
MKLRVKVAFKSGLQEEVVFDVSEPKKESVSETDIRRKAFDKVARMIMTMGKGRGFINTHSFGFRVEDVSFLRLIE